MACRARLWAVIGQVLTVPSSLWQGTSSLHIEGLSRQQLWKSAGLRRGQRSGARDAQSLEQAHQTGQHMAQWGNPDYRGGNWSQTPLSSGPVVDPTEHKGGGGPCLSPDAHLALKGPGRGHLASQRVYLVVFWEPCTPVARHITHRRWGHNGATQAGSKMIWPQRNCEASKPAVLGGEGSCSVSQQSLFQWQPARPSCALAQHSQSCPMETWRISQC